MSLEVGSRMLSKKYLVKFLFCIICIEEATSKCARNTVYDFGHANINERLIGNMSPLKDWRDVGDKRHHQCIQMYKEGLVVESCCPFETSLSRKTIICKVTKIGKATAKILIDNAFAGLSK